MPDAEQAFAWIRSHKEMYLKEITFKMQTVFWGLPLHFQTGFLKCIFDSLNMTFLKGLVDYCLLTISLVIFINTK